MAFAFIGGYSVLVWQAIGLLIGGYQAFSFEHTLSSKLYTQERYKRPPKHIEEDDEKEVVAAVLNREPHIYSYCQRISTQLIFSTCCCCRKTNCYQRRMEKHYANQKIVDSLTSELDIIEIIEWFRIF